jgi:cytoskeletal protein RodZ
MSGRDQARRPWSPRKGRPEEPEWRSSGPENLPQRLLAAREAKGVDLLRAERETKIRRAYLAALEAGDYDSLPGGVYARGFIRNYALYLGLDPEECVAMYTRELGSGSFAETRLSLPRGVEAPRRAFFIPPGLIAAGIVALVAIAILTYIGFQLIRFSEPPSLVVVDPAEGVSTVAEKTVSYTIRGTTVAGGEITIEATGRDTLQATADGDGSWSKDVDLRNGKNQFVINVTDPRTKNTAREPVTLIINVPLSASLAPTLTLDSPAEGASFANGAIPISGTSRNATAVAASATPAGSAAPPPSKGPGSPVDLALADSGSFSGSMDLTAGTWTIAVTARSDLGKTTTLTRTVRVQYQGAILTIDVTGGRTWLKAWVDNVVSPQTGSGGKTFKDGDTVTFRGQRSVEVWTGNPGVTIYTLNGTKFGTLGPPSTPATWLFQPPDPPKQTNRRD